MKKILYIHHSKGIGGAPISLIEIIKSLDKSRYEAEVLLLQDSELKEMLIQENIPYSLAKSWFYQYYYRPLIHIVPSYQKLVRPDKIILRWTICFLSYLYFAPRELKNAKYDILHLNSICLIDFLSPKIRKPKILHVREPIAKGNLGLRYLLIRYLIKKNANQVICISKDNLERLALNEMSEVIYNFTDVPEHCENLNLKEIKKNIIYLGGGSDFKGFSLLIKTLPLLSEDLNIYLCGNYSGDQLRLIERTSMKCTVQVLGLIKNVAAVIDDSILLVCPFIEPHFPRPIIEAFARGRTVVATNISGMNEVVDNGYDGVIIKDNSPQDLAEAINHLGKNENLRQCMASNGFVKAKKLFSRSNVDKICSVYERIS